MSDIDSIVTIIDSDSENEDVGRKAGGLYSSPILSSPYSYVCYSRGRPPYVCASRSS